MISHHNIVSRSLTSALMGALITAALARGPAASAEVLAHWRFEQVQNLKGDLAPSVVGQPLTSDDRRPSDPQPFVADDSGKGNLLEVRGGRASPNVFSENVPRAQVDGKPNTRSLTLKKGEYFSSTDRPLAYYDMQRSWSIDTSLMTNTPEYDQVFLCKEGARGSIIADLSIGYDSMQQEFYAEVKGADGKPYRALAPGAANAGKWYDIHAQGIYNPQSGQSTLLISAKSSGQVFCWHTIVDYF